jgi:phosphatidylserine synthase
VVAIVCVLLSLTQLTNWKFVHPMQVKRFRPITITVTIVWLGTVVAMTYDMPNHFRPADYLLVACPLYIVGLGVWRTLGTHDADADA